MTVPGPGDTWDVVDVAAWAGAGGDEFLLDEPLGTKEKFWVTDPDGRQWLFKFARVVDGSVRGEDWAECLVHLMAENIGVPTARVRLGVYDGRRGVLSRSVVTPDERLEHGNELLASVHPGYDREARRENPGYTVAAVKVALDGIAAPRGFPDVAAMTAFDVFCGYLLLDAWVAGRDRHHENWAAIRSDDGGKWLAPSFDHGNALGFQESEEHRSRVLASADGMRRWAERGRSQHFAGRPSLVRLALDALEIASPGTRDYWFGRLRSVTAEAIQSAVTQVPDDVLSDSERSFCQELLILNRERVLHVD